MDELVKKFYWLIVTTVFGLTITVLTNFVKEITTIEIHNPFSNKFKESEIEIDSILKHQNTIFKQLDQINNSLIKREDNNRRIYRDWLIISMKTDYTIRNDLLVLDRINLTFDKYKSIKDILQKYSQWKETLNKELDLFSFLGESSYKYINDSTSFDILKFHYDYTILRNKYITSYIASTSGVFNDSFWDSSEEFAKAVKILFYFLVLYGLTNFVIKSLIRTGVELWKEKT